MSMITVMLAFLSIGHAESVGEQSNYRGVLLTRDEEKVVTEFRVSYSDWGKKDGRDDQFGWVLEATGAPWHQSFGLMELDDSRRVREGSVVPAIRAARDGIERSIVLRSPYYSNPERLADEAEWSHNGLTFKVAGKQAVDGRECWRIIVSTSLGNRETHWVDVESAILVKYEQLVFLGQGVPHILRTTLLNQKETTKKQNEFARRAYEQLDAVRSLMNSKTDTSKVLGELSGALGWVEKELKATIYERLVTTAKIQLSAEIKTARTVESMANKLKGKALHGLSLRTLSGQKLDTKMFEGKPLVLHFWDYHADPLVAPYGEAGYLDFLYRKVKQFDVTVVGVAVDDKLATGEGPKVQKAIRDFAKFMNISYPVVFDEGDLIRSVGDPRTAGARLPLYVVVGPDGKVVQYHSGAWSKNPDEGLKELHQLLIRLAP